MPFDAQAPAEVTARDRMIRLRDFLAEQVPAERFAMEDYGFSDKPGFADCGTPACIAGWACRLYNMRITAAQGYEHLGLSGAQAKKLFLPFRECFTLGNGISAITLPEAIAVLDHYLATGEIEWSAASRWRAPSRQDETSAATTV